MNPKFNQSFKLQAVKKALERTNDTTLQDIANQLGIGHSTLNKWISLAKQQKLNPIQNNETTDMTTEKRPQDWNAEEKLNIIIVCASLTEQKVSEQCRKRGVFPHHIKQWKQDFIKGSATQSKSSRSNNKVLCQENKALKKELNRKEKALAETAALLVLQKKVHTLWGSGEGN